MALHKNSWVLTLMLGALLAACGGEVKRETPTRPQPKLGLMTSLPIYWPLGAEIGELASGGVETPWQRQVLEEAHELVPLDTLSPIAALDPETAPIDPLSELDRLAVIQPRVLTPADNVALDEWVREGGQLLMVLDPALAGHFTLPLGDPRRPIEAALVPPVLERWGLDLEFDDMQEPSREVTIGDKALPVLLSGRLREIAGDASDCRILGEGVLASCAVGEGRIAVFADAQVFLDRHSHDLPSREDHSDHLTEGSERSSAIQALVAFAFENG